MRNFDHITLYCSVICFVVLFSFWPVHAVDDSLRAPSKIVPPTDQALALMLQRGDFLEAQAALRPTDDEDELNRSRRLSWQILSSAEFQNRSPVWRPELVQSMTAHFDGQAAKALETARSAVVTEPVGIMAVEPNIWLAHLEIWAWDINSFGQFTAMRQSGLQRMERLFELHEGDRRVALLMSQALLADGRVIEALAILEQLEQSEPVDPLWRRKAEKMAKWRPALSKQDIFELSKDDVGTPNEPLPNASADDQTSSGTIGESLNQNPKISPLAIEALDLSAMPPLHKLAAGGDKEFLNRVLPTVLDIDQTAVRGDAAYSAVHLAAELGNLDALEAFAGHGASIDQPANPVAGLEAISKSLPSGVSGGTPLQIAALHGQTDFAKALIDLGAEVETVQSSQISPILAATARADGSLTQHLLRAGANPNFVHPELGSARQLAMGFSDLASVQAMPRQMLAGPTELAMINTTIAMNDVGAGMGVPYTALTSIMTGLVSSEAGQQLVANGLIASWENGTLWVRFGMIAIFLIGSFLFKMGPKLISWTLGSLFSASSANQGDSGHFGVDAANKIYRGQIDAQSFGLTEGYEVEVLPDRISFHGYSPTLSWFRGRIFLFMGKIVLFTLMFAGLGLFWTTLSLSNESSPSTLMQGLGFFVLIFLIPFLALLAEGIVRVLTTSPSQLDLFVHDIVELRFERKSSGANVNALVRKPGEAVAEVRFSATHAGTVQALMSELQRFTVGRQVTSL